MNDFLDRLDGVDRARVIEVTNALVTAFRTADLPIVWVRQEFAPDLTDAFAEMRTKSIPVVIAGTLGAELDPELDVRPSDHMVVKKRYSAFFGTDLDGYLSDLLIDQVVLCGINTHACIRTTAIDAYQRDLSVAIVTDAVGSYDSNHAEVSLNYMSGKIATLVTSASVLKNLASAHALFSV